jgi:hypothetical protein
MTSEITGGLDSDGENTARQKVYSELGIPFRFGGEAAIVVCSLRRRR